MNDLFVDYETALKLKKAGFNLPCIARYTKVDEDDIFWLVVSEYSFNFVTNKIIYGNPLNYNTKFFEKEGSISAPLKQQADEWEDKLPNDLMNRIINRGNKT